MKFEDALKEYEQIWGKVLTNEEAASASWFYSTGSIHRMKEMLKMKGVVI